jgi:transposase
VKAARDAWPEAVAGVAAEDLVFLDETGASTAMHRTHGYAPAGQRLPGDAPHDHWKVVTFLGGLTAGGLIAPWAQAEPMTGEVFLAYVEQFLVPELRPGMVVVMDNLSSHKVRGVREALELAGCRLMYLPPYSPDFNPIEQAFSKFKRLLRSAAARTVEGVYGAMREALGRFGEEECLNYIRHSGYPHATATSTPL